MAGAVAIVAALLLFPIAFLMSMSLVAVVLGGALDSDGAARHEGSELLELET